MIKINKSNDGFILFRCCSYGGMHAQFGIGKTTKDDTFIYLSRNNITASLVSAPIDKAATWTCLFCKKHFIPVADIQTVENIYKLSGIDPLFNFLIENYGYKINGNSFE